MRVMFILDTPYYFQSGIWLHRNEMPSRALLKRGHGIKQVIIGDEFPDELKNWPDTVIFGRTYPPQYDPVKWMKEFKKAGKRVLYDMDDDFWSIAKDNPSALVGSALKDQYEAMIKEADAVITPSKSLEKKFKKYFKKPVFICPNGVDLDYYKLRPKKNDRLTIGYMGAASHWKDLGLIVDVVEKLSEKHDFYFTLYGITGEPLEAAMYTYKRYLHSNFKPEKNDYFQSALDFYQKLERTKLLHIPFMPPELHPSVMSRADIDIGLAPLQDNEFNRGKSCIKYYEYVAVGTVCLASDVEPYKLECNYLSKNTFKDWYNKIEKLIVDEKFRKELLDKQMKWVADNRSVEAIGLPWELAAQKPSKLRTLNQQ